MQRMILNLMIVGSLMAAGCGQQQEQAAAPQTPTSAESQAQGVVQQAQQTVEQGAQAAAQSAQEAQNIAGDMVAQVKDLLAKAQEMLANGQFEQAISTAQNVLSMDPNNMEAKSIIETAKAKLMEMAQQKAGDLKNDVTNKINALGN